MSFTTEKLLREMLSKHKPILLAKGLDDDYKLFCRLLDLPIPRGLLTSDDYLPVPIPKNPSNPFIKILNALNYYSPEVFVSSQRRCYIERLPSEILSDIFLYAFEGNFLSGGPITLLPVCRRWREIALQLTALWTDLQLTAQTQANPLRIFIIYVCHSRRLNVSVTLRYLSNLMPQFNRIVSPYFFKQIELSNLQFLRLDGQTAIDILDSFQFQYPQLEELSLINICHGFPSNIFLGCQSLIDLTLAFNVESFDYILFEKELKNYSISCSNLRIRWNGGSFFEDRYSELLHIRSVTTMTYEYFPGSALLDQDQFGAIPFNLLLLNPHLSILTFKGIDLGEVLWHAPRIEPILHNLGNVERLTLEDSFQCNPFFKNVLNVDEYFPKLRCLILIGGDISSAVVIEFLEKRKAMAERLPESGAFRTLVLGHIPLTDEELSTVKRICQAGNFGLKLRE